MKIINFLHHTFIADFLGPSSVIVDLGANNGEFSGSIKNNFNCKIYALEPLPDLFDLIKEDTNIRKFNYCINSTGNPCELYLESGFCATMRKKENKKSIKIQGKTLKNFIIEEKIGKVDLLKIDIEGEEIEVFENIDNNILSIFNQITVEFHDFLWPELGKRVEKIKKNIFKKGFYSIPFSLTNNGDVLFIRRNLISYSQYLYLKYFLRYILGIKRRLL